MGMSECLTNLFSNMGQLNMISLRAYVSGLLKVTPVTSEQDKNG